MNQKVIIYKGLPGSGKTTAARKVQEDNLGQYVRVNKDDLRAMIFNGKHSRAREELVKDVRDSIIVDALHNGYSVIVDDTNLNPEHLERIKSVVGKFNQDSGSQVVVREDDSFLFVPLEECIRRDLKRGEKVGEKVIVGMWNKYLRDEEKPIQRDISLPNAIVVDIDGTLALHNGRGPFDYHLCYTDRLNPSVLGLVDILGGAQEFVETILVTGRENVLYSESNSSVLDLTKDWLANNGVHYDKIFIRQEGDHRADYIVKEEIYHNHIEGNYNVWWWIDDRKQVVDHMRSLGLPVLDVAGHRF